MNVKRPFDHISQAVLVKKMANLGIDNNFIS